MLQDVPSGLTVETLNISYQRRAVETLAAVEQTAAPTTQGDTKEETPAPTRDLQALRDQYRPLQTVALVSGTCQSPTTLHGWLAKLESKQLLKRVELQSMETVETDETSSHLWFDVQITVAKVGELTTSKELTKANASRSTPDGEVIQ